MLSRDAPRWARAQQRREWDRFTHGELAGATLGIVGYGNSGRELAEKAAACHMRVQALRHTPSGPTDGGVRLLYGPQGLRELLSTSDVVVVTAPLTTRTQGLIGAEELALLGPGGFLVVVSRGGIVDEDALVDALRGGRLAGAGLDAHAHEPLPPESPLWELPNVVITPHNGATTRATAQRGREIALDNVARWARGRPLRNVVDPARGY
jgi:phosphoglycerate dehydrogenase-like enzyme